MNGRRHSKLFTNVVFRGTRCIAEEPLELWTGIWLLLNILYNEHQTKYLCSVHRPVSPPKLFFHATVKIISFVTTSNKHNIAQMTSSSLFIFYSFLGHTVHFWRLITIVLTSLYMYIQPKVSGFLTLVNQN